VPIASETAHRASDTTLGLAELLGPALLEKSSKVVVKICVKNLGTTREQKLPNTK
jgi:hypothetical protein